MMRYLHPVHVSGEMWHKPMPTRDSAMSESGEVDIRPENIRSTDAGSGKEVTTLSTTAGSRTVPGRERFKSDEREVYFIQAQSGPIKIGVSNSSARRLVAIQTDNHEPVSLLGVIASEEALALEASLHEQFAHLRLGGEWFRGAPDLLAYISQEAENRELRDMAAKCRFVARIAERPVNYAPVAALALELGVMNPNPPFQIEMEEGRSLSPIP
jgi:hypothetical protein